MSQKTYWRGIEELNETPEFVESKESEFVGTDLSPLDLMEQAAKSTPTPRRDFLKMMGFSLTAATLAASCEMPVRKVIPYLVKPDEIVPGKANYYATTFADGTDYCSILVKTREGRPIKIEGNDKSSVTRGGTSARVQSSVLNLYDTARLKGPMKGTAQTTWEAADKDILAQLGSIASAGGAIRILSSSIISPSTKKLISEFQAKYTTAKLIQRDAISYSAQITANEKTMGVKALPSYDFEKAEVIVGIGCDFLGTWLSPIEFAKQYSKGRKIDVANPKMSKHYQIESMMSLTGSNADERIIVKPSQVGAAAVALYAKLTGTGATTINPEVDKMLDKVAADLKAAAGKALVVCGVNDVNVQTVVNAINQSIGSNGTTINWGRTCNIKQGSDTDFNTLVEEMKAGSVKALLVINSNPVYDSAKSKDFAASIKNVGLSICMNEYQDETSSLCTYSLPTTHFLESWGDAEPYAGTYSLQQPTIAPLFQNRPYQESLMKWMAVEGDFYTYMKSHWETTLTPGAKWAIALSDGVYETGAASGTATFTGDIATASAAATQVAASKGTEIEIYEKVGMGEGKYANNPWLQELPDPITKCVWDNYALISMQMAEKLGIQSKKFGGVPRVDDDYEYPRELVDITAANGAKVTLPVVFQPGLPDDTIAIALGYGRTKAGVVGNGQGQNIYPFINVDANGNTSYFTSGTVTKASGTYQVAQTQTHHVLKVEDETVKRTVIREATLKTLDKDVNRLKIERGNYQASFEESLYPKIEYKNLKWAMNIDLNACIGCGACAIACHSENNVAVVGKSEVLRIHEMHWLRIDRYYQGEFKNPKVVFQPVMCQHCDNAPCENVCPVNATNHSSEGLNQMAYNRCIGTRYCANNCPYKVRRFNWLDWNNNDSFPGNTDTYISESASVMGDSLMRMVLNPDVTVRSRGVIEKCSFCVQRLQEGKLKAKMENRMLVDGDVKSACQSSCPTDAISFGNVNDKASKIHEAAHNPLSYAMLEEINVQPAVTYKMKVRNIDAPLYDLGPLKDLTKANHGGGHGEEHGSGDHGGGHESKSSEKGHGH